MSNTNALVFFSPLPQIDGTRKTTLGKELKNHLLAEELHKCLVLDMANAYNPKIEDNYDFIWCYSGNIRKFKERKQINVTKFIPCPETRRPIQEIHSSLASKYDRVIIANTCSPLLKKTIIKQSFSALDEHDICIIPMEDGGYALIGANEFHDVYTGIKNWKPRTPEYNLFKETLQKIAFKKKTVHIGPTLFNIITLSDVQKMFEVARYGELLQDQYSYLKNTHKLLIDNKSEFLGVC